MTLTLLLVVLATVKVGKYFYLHRLYQFLNYILEINLYYLFQMEHAIALKERVRFYQRFVHALSVKTKDALTNSQVMNAKPREKICLT